MICCSVGCLIKFFSTIWYELEFWLKKELENCNVCHRFGRKKRAYFFSLFWLLLKCHFLKQSVANTGFSLKPNHHICIYPSLAFLNLWSDVYLLPGIDFYQSFTSSFYVRKSQKYKKTLIVWPYFLLLGTSRVKAACKHMLMKLNPEIIINNNNKISVNKISMQ